MSDPSAIRREVGAIALTFTGLGSIIGSGWLFGAWRAAQLAGPAAIYAWIIGAAIILLVALAYAELGAMFPESGGPVRYGHYSHGSLLGFIGGWSAWIAVVSVIPVEAEASVQYMSSWPWHWAQALYVRPATGAGVLSSAGLGCAAVLIVGYFLLNYWGVRLFARANSVITVFKLIVPAGTAIALIATGFHPGNFHRGIHGGPQTIDFASLLTAVATSGIVFSYNGFQSPVNLAGEARSPGRNVPLAIFGSIAASAIVYLLLQVAFLGAVPTAALAGGWAALDYSSPFAQLALALNLNWLALLLYADAYISPSGTGATYTATGARILYAMERNGHAPGMLGRVHPRAGVPRIAMWFNLAVAYGFLVFFRGWGQLAAVISVATIVTYLIVPISVLALRRTAPALHRPLRIPGLGILAPAAFVFATLLLYWARWPATGEIALLLILPLPLFLTQRVRVDRATLRADLGGVAWFVAYFAVVVALSWAGSRRFDGRGFIPFGWDQLAVAAAAVLFCAWGVRSGWRTPALVEAEAAATRASAAPTAPEARR